MPWLFAALAGLVGKVVEWFASHNIASVVVKVGIVISTIVAVLAFVPVPDWLEDLPGRISSLPTEFWWFADLCQLRFGVSVIGSAYVLRFVLRRVVSAVGS